MSDTHGCNTQTALIPVFYSLHVSVLETETQSEKKESEQNGGEGRKNESETNSPVLDFAIPYGTGVLSRVFSVPRCLLLNPGSHVYG